MSYKERISLLYYHLKYYFNDESNRTETARNTMAQQIETLIEDYQPNPDNDPLRHQLTGILNRIPGYVLRKAVNSMDNKGEPGKAGILLNLLKPDVREGVNFEL